MSDELVYQVALELIPGVGNRGSKQLISYLGSASNVFNTSVSKLKKIPGVGEKLTQTLLSHKNLNDAEKVIKNAHQIGTHIHHYTNDSFPERLKHVPDAPNLLFTKGSGDLNPKRAIAVVGTRKATAYGKRITDKIVSDLQALKTTVYSGLAYGIDIQAHKACLKQGTPTFAVLAGGIDRVYPSIHKKYAEQMLANGGLVTESIPGTVPERHLFPSRNRIIAGITDATIVVEAAEKGGALITAHIADSYDKVVFAVPGELGKHYSEGANRLIATQKALIYTKVEDLVYHLNWDLAPDKVQPAEELDLSEDERSIYDIMTKAEAPIEIDLIAIKSGIPINKVASDLLSMEFKNLVRSFPGKKFGLAQ